MTQRHITQAVTARKHRESRDAGLAEALNIPPFSPSTSNNISNKINIKGLLGPLPPALAVSDIPVMDEGFLCNRIMHILSEAALSAEDVAAILWPTRKDRDVELVRRLLHDLMEVNQVHRWRGVWSVTDHWGGSGTEVWKPIPGTSGRYEASSLGRIRSLVVANGHGERSRSEPLLMTPYIGHNKYYLINLRLNGDYKCFTVHSLVASAFHGPCPQDGWQAAHLDGTRTNNRPGNLKWCSPKENASHKRIHGTVTATYRDSRIIDGQTHYYCTKCREWKAMAAFYRNSRTRCQITSWCKRCSNHDRHRRRKAVRT